MEHELKFIILMPNGTGDSVDISKVKWNATKMFKVWTEGYAATGERGFAMYHGECLAETFEEACEKLISGIDRDADGKISLRNGRPSVWACKCFDNEIDARKSFG